jgi:endonuclease/exonuclease/phosphatase family metal-dependent hydrolase
MIRRTLVMSAPPIPRSARSLAVAASAVATGAMAGCASTARESGPEAVPDTPRIVIDGTFDEWGPCTGVDDPADAGTAELDLREVCLAHDSEAVYLRFDLGRAVNAQGLRGILSLALDVDGDAATGWRDTALSGIDLIVEFTHLHPGDSTRLRYGVRSFVPDPKAPPEFATASEAVDPYALGLLFEPRHTARRIEIRLERGVRLPSGTQAFAGREMRGHLAYTEPPGRAIDVAGPFALPLEPRRAPTRPIDVEDPLARAPGTAFRVLSWNVSRARFLADPEPFRRIFAAVAPDVVLLDEIVPAVTPGTVRDALSSAPGSDEWFVHVGSSGSAQRGAIAARSILEPAPSFVRVFYPDSVHALLIGVASQQLREALANATEGGAPTAGAWVSVGGRRLLLVTLDLVCCGNRADAVEDRIRRMEAASINAAAGRALMDAAAAGREADAVIVGGDFNLVASHTPLDLTASGLGPGGADLVPVYALQLDGRTSATWDGGRGQFPPGQLDYILYTDATLEVRRAFVLETRDLASGWLGRHELDVSDSERASDHRPIVADFSWREQP